MQTEPELLRLLLAWVWTPALVAAGLVDWALHRHQRIEWTAGLAESLLHLLMLAVVGAAMLAGIWLEPTAGLLALLLAAVLVHEACYLADLRVALACRHIPLAEQWVHGFQHLLPWTGLAALMALAPDQALALVGAEGHEPRWTLRLNPREPGLQGVAPLLVAALLLNVLPFAEETWRSLRARQRG